MTRNEYTVDELADVLLRAGFVECNIAACNCGSWHHRYGLPERFSEIKDALMDAGVLNNETGNLPIRAIAKLVEQRDALRSRLAEAERDAVRYRWLRDRAWPFEFNGDTPADADAAIDAAMRPPAKNHTPRCSYWDGLFAQVCNCGAAGNERA